MSKNQKNTMNDNGIVLTAEEQAVILQARQAKAEAEAKAARADGIRKAIEALAVNATVSEVLTEAAGLFGYNVKLTEKKSGEGRGHILDDARKTEMRTFIKDNPSVSNAEIARKFGVTPVTVANHRKVVMA